jgi:Ni/Co efflux regulator RcnB
MKRVLILLTILGLFATPVIAKQQLEAAPVQKHAAARNHAKAKKHAAKKQKKHVKKKLAKHAVRKRKIAV